MNIEENYTGDVQKLFDGGFIYVFGGIIGTLVIMVPLIMLYNHLKKNPKQAERQRRYTERLLRQLDDLTSHSESEEDTDPRERFQRTKFKKKQDMKGKSDMRTPEKVYKMKTHKKRSTIRLGNREIRKARTLSFFERQNARKYPIVRICFTGGPCSGKTTAMAHCADQLRQLGVKTYIVPEVVTLLSKGGASITHSEKNTEKAIKFQINLLKLQMSLEDTLIDIGCDFYPEDKVVILCDMGTMDASVTLTKDSWNVLLDETGWTDIQLRDKRYDMVIHMVTAADGAEEYFKRDTAEPRSEDVEEALRIDRRTRQAWVGHPSF